MTSLGILIAVSLLASADLPPASRAGMSQLRSNYRTCMATGTDKAACKNVFKPVIDQCKDRPDGCNIPMGTDGGFGSLLDTRCPKPDSCQLRKGEPPRDSPHYARLTLGKNEERAELRDPGLFPAGREITYRMKVRIPKDADLQGIDSVVLVQLHATNGQSPPMAIRYKRGGKITITKRADRDERGRKVQEPDGNGIQTVLYGPKDFATGEWHDLKITVRPGEKGYLKVSDGDAVLGEWFTPIGYQGTENYMKFGPYDHSKSCTTPFPVDYADFHRSSTPVDPAVTASVETVN